MLHVCVHVGCIQMITQIWNMELINTKREIRYIFTAVYIVFKANQFQKLEILKSKTNKKFQNRDCDFPIFRSFAQRAQRAKQKKTYWRHVSCVCVCVCLSPFQYTLTEFLLSAKANGVETLVKEPLAQGSYVSAFWLRSEVVQGSIWVILSRIIAQY